MTMRTMRRPRTPDFTTTATVDVEIDAKELRDAGWHYEEDCAAPPVLGLEAAVVSLHRQAHPSQPASVAMCREEPCRRLSLDQLRALPLTP